MQSILKKVTLALVLCTAGSRLPAQDLHLRTVDSFVSYIEQHNRGIGNLTIYRSGKPVYQRTFGNGALPGAPNDTATRYRIGSVTKTYTAVLIFQLVEKGVLSLDTRLAAFYPDMPGAPDITIRQMLQHTSGLGDYCLKASDPDWLLRPVTREAILEEIKSQGLLFSPGTDESYSNSAYFLLACILEKHYGKSFGSIVQQQITTPLRLQHTQSALLPGLQAAPSYIYENGQWVTAADFEFVNTKGAGDIAASPDDMIRFMEALFSYKLLQPATVAVMKPDRQQQEYFGRGLMLLPMRTQVLYGHGGDTRGTHCVAGYNEQDRLAVALVLNGERYDRNNFIAGVLSFIYNEPFEFPVFMDITLTPEELDRYTGLYSAPDFPLKIQVSHEAGVLTAQGTGQPSFRLEATGVHVFQMQQAGIRMEFRPEERTLLLSQGGQTFIMTAEQ